MIDLSLSNAATYWVQVFAVVAAAAIAARVFSALVSEIRFAFWRAVVFACLALPLLAMTRSVPSSETESVSVGMGAAEIIADTGTMLPATAASASAIVGWIVAAGIAVRVLWLALGLMRLQRLRAESIAIEVNEDVDVLKRGLAHHAALRTHARVQQPIAFGFRRPVVLFPAGFESLATDTQRAIACHELLHIQRGDWLSILLEELIRALFWFHPAMRWALNQVQLGREEIIDARVVAIVGARVPYLNALMTFASRPPLMPATLFARRSHLSERIRRISQEGGMSNVRIASGAFVLTALLISAGWIVTSAMPLRVPAELDDATAVPAGTVQFSLASPLPKPTKQVQPVYPAELLRAGVGAQITATIEIDINGRVTGIRDPKWQLMISDRHSIDDVPGFWAGKPWQRFVDAFETAMRHWTFEPDGVSTFPVSVVFTSGGEVRTSAAAPPPPPPAPPPSGSDVREALRRLEEARRKIEESTSRSQGVIGPVAGSSSPGNVPNAAPPAPPPPPGGQVLRVGQGVRAPAKVRDVRPVYPPEAREAGVSGVVILEVRIGQDGTVVDAQVVRSIPLLDNAAVEAVRQWMFEPTLLNGVPVDVIMMVTVNFTLS